MFQWCYYCSSYTRRSVNKHQPIQPGPMPSNTKAPVRQGLRSSYLSFRTWPLSGIAQSCGTPQAEIRKSVSIVFFKVEPLFLQYRRMHFPLRSGGSFRNPSERRGSLVVNLAPNSLICNLILPPGKNRRQSQPQLRTYVRCFSEIAQTDYPSPVCHTAAARLIPRDPEPEKNK